MKVNDRLQIVPQNHALLLLLLSFINRLFLLPYFRTAKLETISQLPYGCVQFHDQTLDTGMSASRSDRGTFLAISLQVILVFPLFVSRPLSLGDAYVQLRR